jgi:hypothetical protein
MLVLDSDHMSLLEWGTDESAVLCERLADVPPGEVVTTIVCYEELARDATLLSRNLADFGKVPGLRIEDWTK